jgi:hypothetical protein
LITADLSGKILMCWILGWTAASAGISTANDAAAAAAAGKGDVPSSLPVLPNGSVMCWFGVCDRTTQDVFKFTTGISRAQRAYLLRGL